MYDDISEEQYQDLVRKRREDNFIEDDGVLLLLAPLPRAAMHPRAE